MKQYNDNLAAAELLAGRNPVREALRSGRPINKIFIQAGARGGSLGEIIALALARGLSVEFVPQEKLERLTAVRHQGVVASVAPVAYATLDAVFAEAAARAETPFLLLLDGLEDPQNVGALIRTAAAVGVHGVLLPKRRSCPLNAVVAKSSAGALHYIAVVQCGNLAQTITELQARGCWVVGADMGGTTYTEAHLDGALALVIGSEGRGLGKLICSKCDEIASLPMRGGVGSLNAAAAGAVLMYEALRQRR